VSVDAIDDAEVSSRFPSISTCGIPPDLVNGSPHACTNGGNLHLLEHAGGYMDPSDALQDLIVAARSLQVDLQFKTEVADIEIVGGAVRGVRFKDGCRVACETVILSAGPWSTLLLDRVGLGGLWPLEPTRIQIAHIDRPPSVGGDLPVCVDMAGGIYFRPQNRGQQIIIGSIREEDELEAVSDADDFARFADDQFIREKIHALSHRLGFPDLRGAVRGYSGLYTMNRKDMHPVVGPTPTDGLMVASGFSGHGFKLAPAIGSLLARAITESTSHFDTTVDESFLSFAREPIKLPSLNVLA
jgi:glycine/D-amino acid oxidase-like deaminating enzyme